MSTIGFNFRLCSLIPRLSRSVVNRAETRPVPPPSDERRTFTCPADFLKAIGRSSETKVSTEKWEDFWKTSGHELKKTGLAVRDRKYILWCMEKYRSGLPVESFAHEPRPKKSIRGWGPAVQNGKRIRSRRIKNHK